MKPAPYFFHVISSNYYNNMLEIYRIIIFEMYLWAPKPTTELLSLAMVMFRGQGELASWELSFWLFLYVDLSTVK